MKRKVVIAVSLALVMLFALSAPVLADVANGKWVSGNQGTCSLRTGIDKATGANVLKISATAKGLEPGETYGLNLNFRTSSIEVANQVADSKGIVKFSLTTDPGELSFESDVEYDFTLVLVLYDPEWPAIETTAMPITFP